jgi:hypothetical protein
MSPLHLRNERLWLELFACAELEPGGCIGSLVAFQFVLQLTNEKWLDSDRLRDLDCGMDYGRTGVSAEFLSEFGCIQGTRVVCSDLLWKSNDENPIGPDKIGPFHSHFENRSCNMVREFVWAAHHTILREPGKCRHAITREQISPLCSFTSTCTQFVPRSPTPGFESCSGKKWRID